MNKTMNSIIHGFSTGMILQLAIGPVFLFLITGSIQDHRAGLAGVLAVTMVDYAYIGLALLGLGKILNSPRRKLHFSLFGSLVILLFSIFAGLATPVFLSLGVFTSHLLIPESIGPTLNFIVGFILIAFGGYRLWRTMKTKIPSSKT